MEYNLTINNETIRVETETDGDGTATFTIGGVIYRVDYSGIDANQLHLSVNGMRTNAYVSPNGAGKHIMINGTSHYVEDADRSAALRPGKKRSKDIPDTVTPPMPAVVIDVLVEPGDTVVRGQGVVVVSAMKMETTLAAPVNGTVVAVNTATGEKVNPGDILIDIDPTEP